VGILKGVLPRHPLKSKVKVNNTPYSTLSGQSEGFTQARSLDEFLHDADPEVVIDAATMLPAPRFRRRGICSKTTHRRCELC
jgi:hypothetical protein